MKSMRWAVTVVTLRLPAPGLARAGPSFAKQTGFKCVTYHLSWPELTRVGRQFKLGGSTLMKSGSAGRSDAKRRPALELPRATMLQILATSTKNTAGADPNNFPRNNEATLQQATLFYAGRIADHFGAFAPFARNPFAGGGGSHG